MESFEEMPIFIVCGGNINAGYIEIVVANNEYEALSKAESIHDSGCATIYNLGNIPEDLYEFTKDAINDGYGSFDEKEFNTFLESR